ncbi:hypothetical protein MHU86_4051 [Fragilaria crotonensis]|nr:hypothetical protein MHU86_4051 [Fragilaria crotonensis]
MHGWYEVVAFLDSDNERNWHAGLGQQKTMAEGRRVPPSKICQTYREKYSLVPDPEEKADMREDIEELLKSIDEKIGNDRTNDEVFAELGNDVPHKLRYSGWNDADEHEAAKLRADADEYTPEAFDKYLSAQIVTDREVKCFVAPSKVGNVIATASQLDLESESHP